MAKRMYSDPCDLARALDVLGGRWALLVIRELLRGPRRFGQLRAALPGVATNILAARLKELEAHAVIERNDAPSGDRGHVYELTPLGERVGPAVEALASWARQLPAA
jgi:DNA-binding HxlR family transcriptional regulator